MSHVLNGVSPAAIRAMSYREFRSGLRWTFDYLAERAKQK